MTTLYCRACDLPRLESLADRLSPEDDVHILVDDAPLVSGSTAVSVAVSANRHISAELLALEEEGAILLTRLRVGECAAIRRQFGC